MSDIVKYLQNPPAEFSPIPFWFWNDELSEAEIERQMREMKDKGVEGFVIHPRKGLPADIPYLSGDYFRYVRFAVEKANELDMKVVLYDEAMYPSGSCHGEVVRSDESFASMGLFRTEEEMLSNDAKIIAKVQENGRTVIYAMIQSMGTIRGVHENEDDGEPDAPRSADLLNPKAVARFIELTHERYYHELAEHFGKNVIAIFTDEPNILGRCARKGLIPWSEGIFEEFLRAGGSKEDLRYLFADGDPDSADSKRARETYRRVIFDRLSASYYRQLSNWCEAHNIALTGHPEKSTDIGYLRYFHVPCQDIVWRFVEPEDGHAIEGEHSTMGKCSSDSARHRGKRRNGNECFGCCGERSDPYKFTEADMRWYLNWLFVRGVNLVYPHAFYYSIRDGRGDERPPEVGLHNPFWPEYRKLSDYIKRMCFLNTDSVNLAQVAVLCSEERLSWRLAKPLFTGQTEFNYLERELLEECCVRDGKLTIAEQEYRVIVAEGSEYECLSAGQKAKLKEFTACGGTLLPVDEEYAEDPGFLDEIRSHIDSEFSFSGDTYELRFSHLKKGEDEYIYLCNEGTETISFTIDKGAERIKTLWDPYSGRECALRSDGSMRIPPNELWVGVLRRE